MRRNVEEFLSPPRQAPARQKDMELECPLGQTFLPQSTFSPELLPKRQI